MPAWIRKIARLFRGLTLREQVLSLLFIVALLLIWTSSFLNRVEATRDQYRSEKEELELQAQVFLRADGINLEFDEALARVDPSRTYSSAQLSGRIDQLVRQAGLVANADIRSVDTEEGEIFNDHNVEVRLDRIEIDKLIRFNNLISSDPYLKLVSTRINAGSNPSLLDVRYEINALELKPEAIQN